MARPPKELDWEVIEKQMEAGCTAKEIAGARCCLDTFYDRFKERYGCSFSEYSDKFYRQGNANLKFTQYLRALSGNNTMLVLLGRERLDQGKEMETTPPREDILAVTHENMLLRAELAKFKDKYADQPQAEPELHGSDSQVQYLGGGSELG